MEPNRHPAEVRRSIVTGIYASGKAKKKYQKFSTLLCWPHTLPHPQDEEENKQNGNKHRKPTSGCVVWYGVSVRFQHQLIHTQKNAFEYTYSYRKFEIRMPIIVLGFFYSFIHLFISLTFWQINLTHIITWIIIITKDAFSEQKKTSEETYFAGIVQWTRTWSSNLWQGPFHTHHHLLLLFSTSLFLPVDC